MTLVRIPELQQALQFVLTDSATEHGATSGWQQRRGQISPSQFVQTLVGGCLESPEATLGHLIPCRTVPLYFGQPPNAHIRGLERRRSTTV